MTATARAQLPGTFLGVRSGGARAWYCVGLLTLLYALSYTDRLALALLAQPVGKDLHLSDGQLGLLLGAGFAVVYAIGGLPIADRIDRGNRIRIIVLGVLLWGAMTMASAFATGFVSLFICRAGVALGEAVLTPAAVSLIADLFSPTRRNLPTTIYGSMSGLMATGAFVVGSAVLNLSGHLEGLLGVEAWRLTLLLLGLPAVLISLLMIGTVRDPRISSATADSASPPVVVPLSQVFAYLRRHAAFYVAFYVGLGSVGAVAYGTLSWFPTILVRQGGLSVAQAGYWIGTIGVATALGSVFFWSLLAGHFLRKGEGSGILLCLCLSCVVTPVALVATLLQSDLTIILIGFGAANFGLAALSVLVPLSLQTYGPREMRARLTSLYLLATSLIGFAIGPSLVVILSDLWRGQAIAIGHGVALNGAVAGGLSVVGFFACWRASRSMMADVS